MRKVEWRPRAHLDRESIAIYLGVERQSPQAALAAIEGIDATIKNICDFPEIGRAFMFEGLVHNDYRCAVSGRYRIFYRFTAETVTIYRVLHQRQSIDAYSLIGL